MATGAVLGGVLWGRFGRSDSEGPVLAALLVPVAVAQLLTGAVAPNLIFVGMLLAIGILAESPIFVDALSASDAVARDCRAGRPTRLHPCVHDETNLEVRLRRPSRPDRRVSPGRS